MKRRFIEKNRNFSSKKLLFTLVRGKVGYGEGYQLGLVNSSVGGGFQVGLNNAPILSFCDRWGWFDHKGGLVRLVTLQG